MLKKFATSEKGFTLIELLIVVAIIGILAAIAIPQFSAYKERSYIASMTSDAKTVATAEEAYFVDNKTYVLAANKAAAITALGSFGLKALSAGNDVKVEAPSSGTIANGFLVTISSDKTGKTVTFDSSTGATTVVAAP